MNKNLDEVLKLLEDNNLAMTFESVIEYGFKLGAEKGFEDPLDKSKYREIITAEKLEHNLLY